MPYYLDKWFGGASDLLIGLAYVAIVLYLPFGIVGTWRAKAVQRQKGLDFVGSLVSGRKR